MGENRPGGRLDRVPNEHKGAHSLTDSQVESEFLKNFTPPKPPEPTPFRPPNVPETKGPQEYILPPGTLVYDEDGREVDRITEPTAVHGTWSRPGRRQGGPAPTFTFESQIPLGRENAGRRIKGVAKRFGDLWFGQTAKDRKPK